MTWLCLLARNIYRIRLSITHNPVAIWLSVFITTIRPSKRQGIPVLAPLPISGAEIWFLLPICPKSKKVDHWYQLSSVDVTTGENGFAIVTLGDSITDGHATATNGNERWPDVLAHRLHAAGLD